MADKQKRSATVIGTFVVGGLVLFLAGVIAFSSSSLFSRKQEFVMYFDGSLKGLNIGSPVSLRGVQIGQVDNIVMEIDRENQRVLTPVYVSIDHERFRSAASHGLSFFGETPMEKLIARGLSAQLQNLSFITGQMYVELEFRPKVQSRTRIEGERAPNEIPTIPSQFERVQATLETVLDSIRRLELQRLVDTTVDTLATAHAASYEFYSVMHKVNERIDPILANMDDTTAEGRKAAAELQRTLQEINTAAQKIGKLMDSVDREVAATGPSVSKSADNARKAFDEVATAMRALRELAQYLERNPDALLTGKQQDRR